LTRPPLALTVGDPSGVGPEIAFKAAAAFRDPSLLLILGETRALEEAHERYAPGVDVPTLPIGRHDGWDPGMVSAAGGAAAMAALDKGIDLVLAGEARAVATGPINKAAVRMAGIDQFVGHTEHLALRAGVDDVAMLLESERLRVVHVTTHRSLRAATEVPPARLGRVLDLAAEYAKPDGEVWVAGLNPHAGEDGAFGREEIELIEPAIGAARERRPDVSIVGPIAPDVIFSRALDRPGVVVVAMYHDQGHIAVKLVAGPNAVNVTLGLPFVRTSVDHGTAHDIAGRGIADPTSMLAAIEAALART
jgi:4-hydroxythreonine-4-phosphate dehydrogenase